MNITCHQVKSFPLKIGANLLSSEGRKSGKQDHENKRSKKKMSGLETKLEDENGPTTSLPEHDETSPIGIDASHDSGMESSSTFTNANHMLSPLAEDNNSRPCQPPLVFPTLSLSLEHKGKGPS